MPLAQPKEKQDHGLYSPGLGLDKPCLTLDYSRSHGIALAIGLAWALVLAMDIASHRQGSGLGGAWGLLSRVLLLERIFF